MKTKKRSNSLIVNRTIKNTNKESIPVKKLKVPTEETFYKYHQIMNKYIKSLEITNDQYKALSAYKGSIYRPINKYLWQNKSIHPHYASTLGVRLTWFEKFFTKQKSLREKVKEKIEILVKDIDDVFKHSNAKFPYSIDVYHGLDSRYYEYNNDNNDSTNGIENKRFNHKIGDIIEYKGYMSTSLDPNIGIGFSNCNKCCLYKIHIPKNSNIIPLVWFKHKNKDKTSDEILNILNKSFNYETPSGSEREFLINRNSKIKVTDVYFVEPIAKFRICSYKKIKDPSNNLMKVYECLLLN